jgi:hypothetical protein
MEKQKAHTGLQFVIAIVALLPVILVPTVIARSWTHTNLTFILFNIVTLGVFELIAFMQLKNLRRIWFDDSGIYIRSLFRNKEEKIAFSDVHRLREEVMTIIRFPGIGGQQFSLSYTSTEGVKTIKFFGAINEKHTKELRKRLSELQNI